MEVINGLSALKKRFESSVVSIGKFDGVHLGHQKLINRTVIEANTYKAKSVVLTFNRSPQSFLNSDKVIEVITPLSTKIELIRKLGIDAFIILHFNRQLAELSPDTFTKFILCEKLRVKKVVIGPDFKFGNNRSGTAESLRLLGEKYGFEVEIIPLVTLKETPISSTKIRKLIWERKYNVASRMLGRDITLVT